MLQYPLSKEKAGPHYWISLHSVASEYPKQGSNEDTEEFSKFVHYFIERFPCQDCRKHGLYYFHKTPPTGTTRKEIFDWACRFHNYVNKHTEKGEVDCGSMLREEGESCKTCSSKPVKVMPEELAGSMTDIKASSKRLFETMCEKEGLPIPKIIFRPCPPFPWTSCTRIATDNSSAVVYLNPTQYGPKTIAHEFVHYREKMKGNDKVAADEWEVDRMAHDIIHKHFPSEMDTEPTGKEKAQEVRVLTEYYTDRDDSSIVDRRMGQIKKRFPHYGAYLDESDDPQPERKGSSNYQHVAGKNDKDGFATIFDDVYKPLGDLLGIDKRDLSLVQVPQIVGNVAGALMDANLSPLGSVIAATVSSLALFGTGVFARTSLSGGDRRFVANLSSNLLYDNIRILANPKRLPDVMDNAKISGYHLSRLDFSNFIDSLTGKYYLQSSEAYGIDLPAGLKSPPSAPGEMSVQSYSPPLSQSIGTALSQGELSRRQRQEFEEAGGVRRMPIGGAYGPGYAYDPSVNYQYPYPVAPGPVPFPVLTPPEPMDDFYDPSNPSVSNPSNDMITSYMNAKGMLGHGAVGQAVDADRLSVNLYEDQDYMTQSQGFSGDEEI